DSRGSGNTFRNNTIHDNASAGVRVGGDTATDGIDNAVYGNNIRNNQAGGIKVQNIPQGHICGNTMANNTGGNAVGTYASRIAPTASCPAGTGGTGGTGGSGGTGGTGADTTAPSTPTGLTAAGRSETSVLLQWTASTDN